jgi:predicted DNA-binding transcriptional regulator YafY
MRADRLVATVLLMQNRGRVTAAELADELEVSVATARRDLEALSAAGVPVYPQPGRGGGWQLVGGARTDLSGLTAGESEALFLLLGPAATARPEARSALNKLVRALPATFREDAQAAARAVTVDPVRWGGLPVADRELVGRLQGAVVRRRAVDLDYRNRAGVTGTRVVRPYGLVDKDGTWYLVAGSGDAPDRPRTYRVDRISAAVVTETTFVPPADLDLDAEWRSTVAAVEAHRSTVWATVRVSGRYLAILRDHFGQYLEVVDGSGELVTLRLGAHLVVGLAEQLAGWGSRIEVLDPPEVQAELARIGTELVGRYASS